MAHREFIDSRGRRWDAWTVVPEFAERRVASAGSPTGHDRREREEFRVQLGSQWANGWLAFSTPGERRRLAPYPANWAELSGEQLEALCKRAVPAPLTRRLVE